MADRSSTCHIGFVLFPNLIPNLTQLDLTGPWEVLTRLPGADCHLLSHDLQPVRSASGLSILPTRTYADCTQLDIIVVPGGPGHVDAMQDAALVEFLRRQAPQCRFLTAVCTGTLVLAAAGLLIGYKATTHWHPGTGLLFWCSCRGRSRCFGPEPADRRGASPLE